MAVKYNIQKGKFILFASAGVSTNVLLQGIIETLVQDNSNNEIEVMNHLHGLKKIYFSGSASIGAEYKLNKNFYLLISPTRRFAINSINKKVAVKSYPNSVGIVTGIRFQF
jgi:cellobiose-specific phosphotransferase system component IIB